MSHFKAEHIRLLKEAATLLELALWKAKIEENEEDALWDVIAKKAKIDIQSGVKWRKGWRGRRGCVMIFTTIGGE
eukprot:scaffold8676_cov139-Skeletonema_marinoi.AAC.4